MPPANPVTSATRVAEGLGSKMALMKPKRTAMSQTMKSTSGPMKGNRRLAADTLGGVLACGAGADQAGAALVSGAGTGAVTAVMPSSAATTGVIR